ncbi:glycosyltransferase family 2 protein [Acidianus manzaensis]|uniref:Glycosyltransferase 2-like domain-containing protein n=1 Tax=Acidianus manzaensis TaxID=282676 RepID=A0A1W6JXE3_9CREN|nr:glycosyltransferase family 2 protein [Acidianus manzaensis]ARM74917.1 hypothetical protein B6F84_02000 [Acidianus manzaensis]
MLISVVIIAHDRKKYLNDAITSVLNQSLRRNYYEIVLVKNFYDDKIDKICKENGIKEVFVSERAVGYKASKGVENSSGDVICFLDDDDMFTEDKLSIIYEEFSKDQELVYIHNNINKIDDDGKILKNQHESTIVRNKIFITEKTMNSAKLAFRNFAEFNSSSICIKKNILDTKVLGKLYRSVDYFYLISAMYKLGKIQIDFRPLTLYRVHHSAMHFTDLDLACKYYSETTEAKKLIAEYVKNDRILHKIVNYDVYTFGLLSNILCKKKLSILTTLKILNAPIYPLKFRLKIFLASIMYKVFPDYTRKLYMSEYQKRWNI